MEKKEIKKRTNRKKVNKYIIYLIIYIASRSGWGRENRREGEKEKGEKGDKEKKK